MAVKALRCAGVGRKKIEGRAVGKLQLIFAFELHVANLQREAADVVFEDFGLLARGRQKHLVVTVQYRILKRFIGEVIRQANLARFEVEAELVELRIALVGVNVFLVLEKRLLSKLIQHGLGDV